MTAASAAAPAVNHFEVETGEMVSLEEMDVMDCLVLKDHKDSLELGGHLDHRGPWDQLDQGVEGSSTPGGERAPAGALMSLDRAGIYIQEELEEVTTPTVEVELTTSVCL